MARNNPGLTPAQAEANLRAARQAILEELTEGNRVTLEDWCTFTLSFTARLDTPDDPLPPLEDCLQVRVFASRPAVDAVRKTVQTERLAMNEKLPQINTAEDTVLKLADVLNADGALRLKGTDLFFDSELYGGECVIAGTRSGSKVQTRFVSTSDSEVVILPSIPSQTDPWNNEYTVSISTRYTEHGTLRTGIYRRRLRTPLVIPTLEPGQETGILTGAEDTAYVTVTGGTASGEATLRIQVLLDLQADCLRFNLLDMTEGGVAGAAIAVTTNGDITLQGFAGSPVTSLDIRVLEYASLKEMLRNTYNCRLVDVLVVQ
ncbi:hypothetical protein [Candidatus Electronema sp. PJ]|uniref:hypothetical protein n=1 Tax=Candidatus Electronema sp. PJ TaxID=3401572 RepID=UPI003AA95B7C